MGEVNICILHEDIAVVHSWCVMMTDCAFMINHTQPLDTLLLKPGPLLRPAGRFGDAF